MKAAAPLKRMVSTGPKMADSGVEEFRLAPLELDGGSEGNKMDDGSAVLASGGEVELFSLRQAGYLMQYFAVGLIYGGLPAMTYGVFQGYLNVPAHVYATVRVIMQLPWSFKFALGMLNDTVPIAGYRRKPYMAIGWAFCALMLVLLWRQPLPDPYWCRREGGGSSQCHTNGTSGETAATVCNEDASEQGGQYALMMMAAAFGYVVADVAADGLTVEFARREPEHRRGKTQTTAVTWHTPTHGWSLRP